MSKNLYVGNLAFGTTSSDLEQLFGQYGKVTKAQVVMDRETGQSRGFGFVEMAAGGDEAIKALNLTEFRATASVNEARPHARIDREAVEAAGRRRTWRIRRGRRWRQRTSLLTNRFHDRLASRRQPED